MSFWSDVSDFFSSATKAVGEAIDFVGQTVAGIIGGVGDVIDATFDFAGATVESGATFVGKVVGTTFDIITGQYGKQNTIGQTIENAITTVGQLAGGLLDGVGELIGGTFNRIADAISYTSENVGETLGADLEEINASFDSFRRNIHRTLDRFEGDINPVSQETLGSGTPVTTDAEKSKIVLELEDLFFQKNVPQSKIDEDFIKTEIANKYELLDSFSSPGEIELHGFEAMGVTQQRYRTRHRFFGNVLGQWINWPFVTSRFEARNPGAILGGKMPKLSRSFSSEKSYSPSMLM